MPLVVSAKLNYRKEIKMTICVKCKQDIDEDGDCRGCKNLKALFIAWKDITESQFKKWGVKHHDLKLGKPAYDLFICDKVMNSNTFFEDSIL